MPATAQTKWTTNFGQTLHGGCRPDRGEPLYIRLNHPRGKVLLPSGFGQEAWFPVKMRCRESMQYEGRDLEFVAGLFT